ncbi:MAG TPA: hypothetical protein VK277_13405 [Acidimicrobiales bacterium]|nr:hypothetical protein [Acidimicrobiales bacterium]
MQELLGVTLSPGLPIIPTPGCTGPLGLDPICLAGGVGSTLASGATAAVLSGLSGWVVSGAAWLLGQLGGVLTASTSIDLGASWFDHHYTVMFGLAALVALPMLLLATIQAVYRQQAGLLLRSALVHLPLALLLGGAMLELVQMALGVTDAMSRTVAAGSGVDLGQALSQVATVLSAQAGGGSGAPAFVVLVGALVVAFGAFSIWVELLVRAAAVYVAVLFLPLALASLIWPAVSHWCRRLFETLAALILAKFVIVAVLSLAVAAVGSGVNGSGFAPVLAGGALLLLATFTPFTLLRLIPAVEAGAVHHLEGARQRVEQAVGHAPKSAAAFALRQARSAELPTGPLGTGLGEDYEPPSHAAPDPPASELVGAAVGRGSGPPGAAADGDRGSIPLWRGVPGPDDVTGPGGEAGAPARPDRPPPPLVDPAPRPPSPEATPGAPRAPTGPPPALPQRHGVGFRLDNDELGPVLHFDPPARRRRSGGDDRGD